MDAVSGNGFVNRTDATLILIYRSKCTLMERMGQCAKALKNTLTNTRQLTCSALRGAVVGAMIGGVPVGDWEASPATAIMRGALMGCALGALYDLCNKPTVSVLVPDAEDAEADERLNNLAVHVHPFFYSVTVVDATTNVRLQLEQPINEENPVINRIQTAMSRAKPFLLGSSFNSLFISMALLSEGLRNFSVIQNDSEAVATLQAISKSCLLAISYISIVFNTRTIVAAIQDNIGDFAPSIVRYGPSIMAMQIFGVIRHMAGGNIANSIATMLFGSAILLSRVGPTQFARGLLKTMVYVGVPGAFGAGVGAITGSSAIKILPIFQVAMVLMGSVLKAAVKDYRLVERASHAFAIVVIVNYMESLPNDRDIRKAALSKIINLSPEGLRQFTYLMIEELMRSQPVLNESNTLPMLHEKLPMIRPFQQAFWNLTQKESFSILGDQFPENQDLLDRAKALAEQFINDPRFVVNITKLIDDTSKPENSYRR